MKLGEVGCDGEAGPASRDCDDKTISAMYRLAQKWGYENAVWNKETRERKTRQAQKQLGSKGPDERGISGRTQLGYGETTVGSIDAMLKLFKELSSRKFKLAQGSEARRREYLRVVETMSFDSRSHFLDIGSGLGKSVVHLVMATGCRGTGVEVALNRFNCAEEFLRRLVESKTVPAWVGGRVHYINADAAASVSTPITVKDGEHPSHIFMFSRVFGEKDLQDIARRLNLTDYKVVVCCVNEKQI